MCAILLRETQRQNEKKEKKKKTNTSIDCETDQRIKLMSKPYETLL